jgi:hypothetical protein
MRFVRGRNSAATARQAWTLHSIAMYLVPVDQTARDDIAATAALHNELGRDYHDALAENLVERIGAEIDKRVDARLGQHGQRPLPPVPPAQVPLAQAPRVQTPPAQAPAPSRNAWVPLVLGLGTTGLGVAATAITLAANTSAAAVSPNGFPASVHSSVSAGQVLLVMVIWVVIAVVNVAYNRRR